MRLNSTLLALGMSLGLSLPALAQVAPTAATPLVVANHGADCKTDCKTACGEGCKDGKACPHKGGAACEHDQAGAKKGDCCEKKEACCERKEACCAAQGKKECCAKKEACCDRKEACCAAQGKKEDCCEEKEACSDKQDACEADERGEHHAGKACDHGDKDCDDECEDACEHGGMGGHGMMGQGGMGGRGMMGRHGRGLSVGLRNFWNQGNGASYLNVAVAHMMGGRRPGHTWWNPGAGMGCEFGIDPTNPTVNRHFMMVGPVVQNTMAFGPINVTLGLQAALGAVFDTTNTLSFQNANHFYGVDPRLTVGWQMTPRASLNLTGSYLFTTRPAAAGGPTAGLSMNYGF